MLQRRDVRFADVDIAVVHLDIHDMAGFVVANGMMLFPNGPRGASVIPMSRSVGNSQGFDGAGGFLLLLLLVHGPKDIHLRSQGQFWRQPQYVFDRKSLQLRRQMEDRGLLGQKLLRKFYYWVSRE